MKIKVIIILLIISLLLLSSCSGGPKMQTIIKDNDDKKADVRFEQVIESIKNKDKEALKEMFSKQSLDESEDIDDKVDYLFEFFQGEVLSWKRKGPIVDEKNHYGHKVKESKSFYTVKTDEQEYLFFLLEYTEDTDNPDNVGLYTLRVIKAEDEETQFGYWQDMKIAGIYKPEE